MFDGIGHEVVMVGASLFLQVKAKKGDGQGFEGGEFVERLVGAGAGWGTEAKGELVGLWDDFVEGQGNPAISVEGAEVLCGLGGDFGAGEPESDLLAPFPVGGESGGELAGGVDLQKGFVDEVDEFFFGG